MQALTPKLKLGSEGELLLSPVLDMLGVRYVIGRGVSPAKLPPRFSRNRLLGARELQCSAPDLCPAPG